MTVLWISLLAIVLATLAEGMVEYVFGTLFKKLPKLTPYSWVLMYVSLAVGIGLTYFYQVDLIAVFGEAGGFGEYAPTLLGCILSGFVVGRGANYTHQFITKFLTKPDPA